MPILIHITDAELTQYALNITIGDHITTMYTDVAMSIAILVNQYRLLGGIVKIQLHVDDQGTLAFVLRNYIV